jgi:hypothetical protein
LKCKLQVITRVGDLRYPRSEGKEEKEREEKWGGGKERWRGDFRQ